MLARRPYSPIVADYELRGADYVADPYPIYRRMAESDPVWPQEATGHVYVSRYADVKAVLLDSETYSSNRVEDRLRRVPDNIPATCLASILHDRLVMTDGPKHRALRVVMREAFTAAKVRTYQPMIDEVISEHLATIDWSKPVDFMEDIAIPIPSKIILLVLGFPPDDFHELREWTGDFYNWLASSPEPIEVRTQKALHGTGHMYDYIFDRVKALRAAPTGSLLCQLVNSNVANELTEEQVVANLVGIVNAAHETTTSLMANTMIMLLEHRDQLELIQADPELIPGAVNEVGRLESPSQIISRVATRDVDLHGVRIPEGALVAINLAQANRDPDVYPDPDRFDVTRKDAVTLTFGHGAHFCVGTALARMEVEELLHMLLPRMTGARILTDPIVWRPTPAFRCPEELVIQFG